jgi:HD-GYP domain-containing protein (c-di-GMP phosphodiesterase class II)
MGGAALVPWTAGKLATRRAMALSAQLNVVTATEREAVMMLARASETKDSSTGDHVVRVGDLAAQLADRAGLTGAEASDLRFAAMLHDVGKLHVPDSILQKPGPLSADEWEIVKNHTVWGERILGSSDAFELARRVARWHHENFDGSGYPDGLCGSDIPLAARIVRVADVFDALANERAYKQAWDTGRVLDEFRAGAGTRYDPDLARELIQMFEAHAISIVEGNVGNLERRVLVGRFPAATAVR